ncbi:unnamed protein product [Amoebophrya sp. A25]|nr:unnamed protein product [Amoebophrya sp. A25]|eukprot:GSA25T00004881001.1
MTSVPGFVRIVTTDGHEFVADEKILDQCDVLKKMVASESFEEGTTKTIVLKSDWCVITGKIMQKVLEYLYYRYRHTDSPEPIPEFVVEDDIVLEVLPVANFLGLNY